MQVGQTKVDSPALTAKPVCHFVSLIEGTPPPKKLWSLVSERFCSRNVGPMPAERYQWRLSGSYSASGLPSGTSALTRVSMTTLVELRRSTSPGPWRMIVNSVVSPGPKVLDPLHRLTSKPTRAAPTTKPG